MTHIPSDETAANRAARDMLNGNSPDEMPFDDPIGDLTAPLSDAIREDMSRRHAELAAVRDRVAYTPPTYTETCKACNGTGKWGYYQNRRCFKCDGAGKKTFKTSAADRAHSKELRQARHISKIDAWKAEFPAESEWIDTTQNFAFADAMREALAKYGSLTDGQLAAVRKCLVARANYLARQATRARENAQNRAVTPNGTNTEQPPSSECPF